MGPLPLPLVRGGREDFTTGVFACWVVLFRGCWWELWPSSRVLGVELTGVRGCVAVVNGGGGRDGRFWTGLV